MITPENLGAVITDLSKVEIEKVLQSQKDFVKIWININNSGFSTIVSSHDYDDKINQECDDNGMLFINKDDFLTLLEDCNIIETLKIEY